MGFSPDQVHEARDNDNINVLALAADSVEEIGAIALVEMFLMTDFVKSDSYLRRIDKITRYERESLSEAQLRNTVLPPFEAAVKAGVGTFMSAYMDLNNVPASGNSWLLNDILRGEWGFDGFVVSDASAVGNLVIQGFARDKRDAALRALKAGLNMDMASSSYLEHAAELVRDGSLSMEQVDELVRPPDH